MIRLSCFYLLFFYCLSFYASDSLFVKVYFVHGSKPKSAFKKIESKLFGGIHGGHVFVEVNNKIISFGTNNGKWHIFPHKNKSAGKYRVDKNLAWHGDTAKKKITTIVIPISENQLNKFKQAEEKYLENTPYDYAFLGMRCASGAYDMLSKAEVCKHRSKFNIIYKNFYPKRLRIKLLKRAQKENWLVLKEEGRTTRKWEKD